MPEGFRGDRWENGAGKEKVQRFSAAEGQRGLIEKLAREMGLEVEFHDDPEVGPALRVIVKGTRDEMMRLINRVREMER
jgi:hypothetical protein